MTKPLHIAMHVEMNNYLDKNTTNKYHKYQGVYVATYQIKTPNILYQHICMHISYP